MDIKDLLSGAAIGIAAETAGVLYLFRNKMVIDIKSPKSFEETCEAIERVIPQFESEGWGFPFDKWNFYKVFESRNLDVDNINKLMVYFICNAKLAARVISTTNAMAGIMPCSWAVSERNDGVYISKMNIGLMAKIFSGEIKKAMEIVEETEKRMLKKIFE